MENENLEFLKHTYLSFIKNRKRKIDINDPDALIKWLFASDSRTEYDCAHRAYRDLCRRMCGIGKISEEAKRKFRQDIEKKIVEEIRRILVKGCHSQETFDNWHGKVCRELEEISDKHKKALKKDFTFTYGLAQKWLNMTLKYMMIIEDSRIALVKKYLHVPVDSYIMQAAWEDKQIKLPHKEGKEPHGYSESITKPWSRWEETEYIKFQSDLRKQCVNESPIEWEGPAWICIADKRERKKAK